MDHTIETLTNGTKVYCSADHRCGTDALLLARFCPPHRAQRAADLCSGCGIVSLEWHDGGHTGPCTAVEIAPEGSALLAEACAQNGYDHITPVLADLRQWQAPEAGFYDVAACNPPYFTAGQQSANAARATARHETSCELADVCRCAARLLRDGGRFAMCHRPSAWPKYLPPCRRPGWSPSAWPLSKTAPGASPGCFWWKPRKTAVPA